VNCFLNMWRPYASAFDRLPEYDSCCENQMPERHGTPLAGRMSV
jgi:hypothetical protein